jgi:hypothetical protein
VYLLFSLQQSLHLLLRLVVLEANFSAIPFPLRSRAKRMSHFMPIATLRFGLISVGIWKVAPPIRRLRTSTEGGGVFECFVESLVRIGASAFGDQVHGIIEDIIRDTLLSLPHHIID